MYKHSNWKCARIQSENLLERRKPCMSPFFSEFSVGKCSVGGLPAQCCHPWLHSWAVLTCRPARGSAGAVCLRRRGRREACEHGNAVFNFLLLPTHLQGIPGKTLGVHIMTMSSFIKRGICQKGSRDTGPKWLQLRGVECVQSAAQWRPPPKLLPPSAPQSWASLCSQLHLLAQASWPRRFHMTQPEPK